MSDLRDDSTSYILMFRWQPSFAQRLVSKLLRLKPKERKLGANIQLFNRIFRLGLTPPFELLFQFFANRHTDQDLLWLGLCMRSSETRTTPWLGSRRRSDRGKDLKDVQELTKKAEGVAEFLAGTHKRIDEHHAVAADLSK